jgi:hypothetical protein
MQVVRRAGRVRVIVVLGLIVALVTLSWWPFGATPSVDQQASTASRSTQFDAGATRRAPDNDNEPGQGRPDAKLYTQAQRTSNLDSYANDLGGTVIPTALRTRRALLAERASLRDAGDVAGVARLNAVLTTEAFERAANVTTRWLDHRDKKSGLFPHTLSPKDRYWSYGDVGSDLYPFLTIAAHDLLPARYPEMLDTLAAERRMNPGLPRDLMLDTLLPRQREPELQVLANVEYVKDGLLPLLEELGLDPWLGRIREVVVGVLNTPTISTPRGPIPSEFAEVNGSLLQAMARLSWADPDSRYIEMGRRITALYLDDTLPATGHIPPQRWDFMKQRAIGDADLHLGDHGDEIISGLIEWQRVEIRLNLPEQAAHSRAINRMLDRLLETGRTPTGMWYDGIRFPSGKVLDRTLNDNWGYLGQAYLNQAANVRISGDGGQETVDRYERAASQMLSSVTDLDFYKWERGDMDGYADTLESAMYLLRYLDSPVAAQWVDEQMAVLYGFQRDSGAVTDENIDGNFIRTVMLYGRWLTRGARIEPWNPGVALGAAQDGACVQMHLHSETAWTGRLLFDTPRHSAVLGLDADYPRLNQWPEWWVAQAGRQYAASLPDGTSTVVDGTALAAGLPLTVEAGKEYRLRICPQ